jgi:ribose transport system substrate-binding protein
MHVCELDVHHPQRRTAEIIGLFFDNSESRNRARGSCFLNYTKLKGFIQFSFWEIFTYNLFRRGRKNSTFICIPLCCSTALFYPGWREFLMKKLTWWIVCAAFLASLSGCKPAQSQTSLLEPGQVNTPVSTRAASPKTVALVMKTLTNPFFVEMEKGARKAEKDLGIQLIVKTAAQETSIQQQIAIVEELIKAQVDAIVIAPGDSKELIQVLKKAQDAGIVVVNIDNRLDPALSKQDGLLDVPFISVDNQKGAYLSAKYIADQIKTPTKVVVLEGIRGAQNAEDRKAGALKAFKENPNITVTAMESANWKIDEAHDVVAKLFETTPGIGAVFAANDMMALGVIQYLDEKKLTGVKVAGYDNLAEVKQALLDGKLAATIDQQAAMQGYMGILYADKKIKGESVPLETFVDVILVTKDTLK